MQGTYTPSARRESSFAPVVFSDDSDDDGPEPTFSDGEDAEPGPTTTRRPFEEDGDGFDFSGTVLADGSSPACALCNVTFDVRWDGDREAFVCVDAVMLRHTVYHTVCLKQGRGPVPLPGVGDPRFP